jgi:hypothetical protein
MRIGLLTFHFSDNYGALLQAFCLQTYLQSLGHQVEFIDYHPLYVEQGGDLSEILRPDLSKKYLKKLYLFLSYKRRYFFSTSGPAAELDAFRAKYLNIGQHLARSYDQLEPYLDYDHILVGSDQIWNPSDQFGLDSVYYGYPFSARMPVSSYAASFGSVSRIVPFAVDILPWIRLLYKCSVREGEAQAFILSNHLNCELVPDPTILVDDIGLFKQQPLDIDFSSAVFAYALRTQAGVSDFVSQLSFQLGLTPISASTPWRRWKKIGREINLNPFTFLGSIASSRLVVSNSFHAIVCSVLLRKEFIAVSLPGAKAGLSSRIGSFLTAVGLEERLILPNEFTCALHLAGKGVDWSSVETNLLSLRSQGRLFLDSALNKPPE